MKSQKSIRTLKVVFIHVILLVNLGCVSSHESAPTIASCSESAPVNEHGYLKAGDAELYLLARAAHCDAPVILWLHGGPGGAQRPLFQLYNRSLEETFVVVYLDQRGAGRSFNPQADPANLTVARHVEDLDVVVDYLRMRFETDKVFLAGHSWGSALGMLYTQAYPEKVGAFVGVAQFVSGIESQRAQFDFVSREATVRNDKEGMREIAAIGPPPYSSKEELRIQTLVDKYGGYFHTRPNKAAALLSGVVRGYVTPWEIGRLIRANEISLEAMNEELLSLDLREAVRTLETPVIFMLGRFDRQLDSEIAAAYFDELDAPYKSLIWFENSAHHIPFEEPKQFNATLIRVLEEHGHGEIP